MRPVDPVTLRQAAAILGCGVSTVRRHILAGRLPRHGDRYEHLALSRADVEGLACQVYDWRRHTDDPDSYWITGQAAADILGLSRPRVLQLGDAGKLPFVAHRDGARLYRRAQLEVIASARARRAASGVRAR